MVSARCSGPPSPTVAGGKTGAGRRRCSSTISRSADRRGLTAAARSRGTVGWQRGLGHQDPKRRDDSPDAHQQQQRDSEKEEPRLDRRERRQRKRSSRQHHRSPAVWVIGLVVRPGRRCAGARLRPVDLMRDRVGAARPSWSQRRWPAEEERVRPARRTARRRRPPGWSPAAPCATRTSCCSMSTGTAESSSNVFRKRKSRNVNEKKISRKTSVPRKMRRYVGLSCLRPMKLATTKYALTRRDPKRERHAEPAELDVRHREARAEQHAVAALHRARG